MTRQAFWRQSAVQLPPAHCRRYLALMSRRSTAGARRARVLGARRGNALRLVCVKGAYINELLEAEDVICGTLGCLTCPAAYPRESPARTPRR